MALEVKHFDIENSNSVIWDSVASCFKEVDSSILKYTPGKDNYETVWPILCQIISQQLPQEKNQGKYRACDFGCGTGILAKKMDEMNFKTFACDISKGMILQAHMENQSNVIFDVGSIDFVQKYSPYKLITAIMVFQFIADLNPIIEVLSRCLDKNGLLFFATHHIEYVKECTACGTKFRNIEGNTFPTQGDILIGTKWVKTYIRSAEWYDNILSSNGLHRIKYSLKGKVIPTDISQEKIDAWSSLKYYIACYKKDN